MATTCRERVIRRNISVSANMDTGNGVPFLPICLSLTLWVGIGFVLTACAAFFSKYADEASTAPLIGAAVLNAQSGRAARGFTDDPNQGWSPKLPSPCSPDDSPFGPTRPALGARPFTTGRHLVRLTQLRGAGVDVLRGDLRTTVEALVGCDIMGSPLAHAAILVARKARELQDKQAERELPICRLSPGNVPRFRVIGSRAFSRDEEPPFRRPDGPRKAPPPPPTGDPGRACTRGCQATPTFTH